MASLIHSLTGTWHGKNSRQNDWFGVLCECFYSEFHNTLRWDSSTGIIVVFIKGLSKTSCHATVLQYTLANNWFPIEREYVGRYWRPTLFSLEYIRENAKSELQGSFMWYNGHCSRWINDITLLVLKIFWIFLFFLKRE